MQNLLLFAVFLFTFNSPPGPGPVIKAKSDFFEADNLGNIYTVRNEELCKYLPNGKRTARYSNLRFGNITSIDVSNPLKILLYYRDFQQILFLDNQLSVNSNPVSLELLGLEQAHLVCISANNSFWVYNKQNNELLRFDETGKRIAATGNLKQILQADLSPTFMIEYNGYLFLNSPASGIYVFDMFGAFSKVISVMGLRYFQPEEDIIFFQRDSALCSYNHKLFDEGCRTIPGITTENLRFRNKTVYAGNRDSIFSVVINETGN